MTDYFRIVMDCNGCASEKRQLYMVCDFTRWEGSNGQRDHCKEGVTFSKMPGEAW